MKWMLVAAAALGLAGCATTFPKYVNKSFGAPSSGTSVVTIERGKWLPGYNGTPTTILVDGEPAATIGGGQEIDLNVPTGRHSFAVGTAMGFSKGSHPIYIDVMPGESYRAHIAISAGGYGGFKIKRLK